eukprot:1643530-Karenia_brevis.AAC.1
MALCAIGGRGGHAVLKRFDMDNKKFITRNGKHFTLGTWIRAVQQGRQPQKQLKQFGCSMI